MPSLGASRQGWLPAPERTDPVTVPGGPASIEPSGIPRGPAVIPRPEKIERVDLGTVTVSDGTGLPLDLWRGVDAKAVEDQLSSLQAVPRSMAFAGLWRRLWLAAATPPQAGASASVFTAIRAEALLRAGRFAEALDLLDTQPGNTDDAVLNYVAMRARMAVADLDAACKIAQRLLDTADKLPNEARSEAGAVLAYCMARAGTPEVAGLAADLARDRGLNAPFALAVFDAVAAGAKLRVAVPKSLGPLDYRILTLHKEANTAQALERADTVLLASLARDETTPARIRVLAAEGAARRYAIDDTTLAAAYRAAGFEPADIAQPLAAKADPLMRRALLLRAIDAARPSPLLGPLLDDARSTGLLVPVARQAVRALDQIAPGPEAAELAEMAVEAYIAADRPDRVAAWLAAGGRAVAHWRLIADIAGMSPPDRRAEALATVEALAVAGSIKPLALHRLATVLDALDYQIPIPLWEAASRTPQPAEGYLPESGLLPALMEAAKRKEVARTVLLVARALGPDGPETTHIIALGDAIRALRRVGLTAEARAIGIEALLPSWPRGGEERRR